MTIKVHDLDQAEAWGTAAILPPGRHLCEIDSVEEGISSGGHDQITLELRAIAGSDVGGTIRDWVVVTPKSYGRVRQILEACNIEIGSGEWELPLHKLKGAQVAILVRMEPDNQGRDRNRVVAYDEPKESDRTRDTAVPADMEGLPTNGSGASARDETIPF